MAVRIAQLPEKYAQGVASATRCQCGRPSCGEILYYNGKEWGVKVETGWITNLCAVQLNLVTVDELIAATN